MWFLFFVFEIIPGFIFAIVVYKFLPKIPQELRKSHNGKFIEAVKAIFANKVLRILTVISIMKAMVTLSFCVLTPFLFKELGYTVDVIGNTVAAFAALGGLASPLGGRVADKFGFKRVFYISLLPILPLTLLFLHFIEQNPPLALSAFSMVGFFTMFSVSVNIIMAQKALPDYKGMISGVIGGFSWGVMGILLTPLGFLANKFGVEPILLVVAIVTLFACFSVRKLPE